MMQSEFGEGVVAAYREYLGVVQGNQEAAALLVLTQAVLEIFQADNEAQTKIHWDEIEAQAKGQVSPVP